MCKLSYIYFLKIIKNCLRKDMVSSVFFVCPSSMFTRKAFLICIHKSQEPICKYMLKLDHM